MESLKNYVEINEKKLDNGISLPSEKVIDTLYTKCFGEEFRKKCNSSLTSSRSRHQIELLRGFFGDSEKDIIKNIHKLLGKYLKVPEGSYELTYMIKDPDGGSGLYPSVHIDFLNDFSSQDMSVQKGQHVCVTCLSSTIVRKKQITPDQLGLTDNTFYKSPEEVVEKIKKSPFFKLKSSHKVVISILLNLIDAICKSDSGRKYKSFQELAAKEDYSRDLGDIVKNANLKEGEYNNILNDFGEVLGPCFILSKLEGKHTLFYPKESNNPLYDYIIDSNTATQVYVSAKANAGANPTSTVMARNIYELTHLLAQTPNVQLNNADPFYVSRVIPILAGAPIGTKQDTKTGKYTYLKKGYITWIHISLLELMSEKDDNCKKVLDLFKEYGVTYDKKTKVLDDSNLVNLKKKDKLKDFLTKLYALIDYKPSSKYSIDVINDSEFMKNKMLRQGCIRYPIASYICRILNKEYEESISICCQIALGAYQIYLVNKNEERLDITIKNMSSENQKYSLQPGSLVSNPDNCSIKIHLIK